MSDSKKILFFGTPDFAAASLAALLEQKTFTIVAVVTQPDKPAGRGKQLTESPVKKLAVQNGIPVIQPHSLKKELVDFLEQVLAFGPIDAAVVVAFGQILPAAVLAIPNSGCINVHASLLPRWRGAAPLQRCLIAGDSESGVCLMQMEVGLDTGGVYVEGRTAIEPEETGGSLHDKLAVLGAQLLKDNLLAIIEGKINATPQPVEGVTYAEKIVAADCLIDWSQPADRIAARVRALSPYPAAYSTLQGKRFKIYKAKVKPVMNNQDSTPPGGLVYLDSSRMEALCGSGDQGNGSVLELLEVQIEGKRRMQISDFLRGYKVATSDRLG